MLASEMSIEQLANALVKNRVEFSNLSTQLHRIEKEKQMEMRMLNNEKLKFRAKYLKTNLGPVPSEASDIKMFETHTPGFCFKRNGEQRIPSLPTTPSMDFNHLQFLLFTNGEVDVEKILCLHLLSSHETKHLTPTRQFKGSYSVLKKHSPLEQLIERSKEASVESVSSSVLPTYVLDVNKQKAYRSMEQDERLVSRLITNEKISKLISTVIKTLEVTNPEKLQDLISIAFDRGRLKRIFKKPHIQDFVMLLKENCLINSCSSFVLIQKEAKHIEIRTPSGVLEDLVRYIRSNVLQFSTRSSFETLEQEAIIRNVVENVPPPPPVLKQQRSSDFPNKLDNPRFKTEVVNSKEQQRVEEVEVEINNDYNPFRRTTKNFIAKNIAAVANYKQRSEESEAVEAPKRARRKSSVDVETPKKEATRAPSVSQEHRSSRSSSRRFSDLTQTGRRLSDEVRVHSKQTTCPACMERWKIPLPAPKVSKLMKSTESSVHSMESSNPSSNILLVKTNNVQQRISMLIHKEQFKLDSYDRKYSNASSSSRSSTGKRKNSLQNDSIDQVDLNVFDLEKIRQEIREKETKKKLEKFLGD